MHKPWFNIDCEKVKNEVRSLSKLLCKNPNDTSLRSTFNLAKRNLKHTIKRSRQEKFNSSTRRCLE